MVTEVKLAHAVKTLSPIDVTELGIVTEIKSSQPLKAPLPIDVTEFGIVTELTLLHP